MSQDGVLIERDDAVARVVLNRPDRRNALNDELVAALDAVLRELSTAPWCRAVVLTGAGSAFCAGGDMADNAEGDVGRAVARQRRFLEVADALLRLPKPTVAAVNGAAVGAGFSLALLCDEVVLHATAKLSLGFLRVALPPDLLSAMAVQRRAGWTVATDLLHSGRFVPAGEAVSLHLAHASVDGDVVAAATERARRLAELSPFAFAATKTLLREAAGVSTALSELEAMAVGIAATSPDFAAATSGFRRAPSPEAEVQ